MLFGSDYLRFLTGHAISSYVREYLPLSTKHFISPIRTSITTRVLGVALGLTTACPAQILFMPDVTSTPVPGVAHDYIRKNVEAVNSGNNSIGIRTGIRSSTFLNIFSKPEVWMLTAFYLFPQISPNASQGPTPSYRADVSLDHSHGQYLVQITNTLSSTQLCTIKYDGVSFNRQPTHGVRVVVLKSPSGTESEHIEKFWFNGVSNFTATVSCSPQN